MINPKIAATLASFGAQLLDQRDPSWYRSIDSESIMMEEMKLCVLGQQHGNYRTGVIRLNLTETELYAGGFNVDIAKFGKTDIDESYRNLSVAWRVEVEKRQKAGVGSG